MELLDIYDNNGHKTNKQVVRGDKNTVLNDNEHIAVSIIFIENSNGEFLIQKTSKDRGNDFSSTGGHVINGETPLEAIKREVKEELGVSIDNEDIKYLGFIIYDTPIRFLYYLKKDLKLEDVKVQKEEVDYVEYMTIDQINKLIDNNLVLKSHGILFKEVLKKIKGNN